MRIRILRILEQLRESYWFVPGLMALGAGALAAMVMVLDSTKLPALERAARIIPATHSGYVQAIDAQGLLALALEHDLLIELYCRPGHFVAAQRAIGRAVPGDSVDEAPAQKIVGCFLPGPERTATQDPGFAVNQLVEIALRALSPGINDPFTAINCVDKLGAALCLLAARELPPAHLCDQEGRRRLLLQPYTYTGIVEASFNQIRQGARTNVALTIKLLETLATIAENRLPAKFRMALQNQTRAIHEVRHKEIACALDRSAFDQRYEAVRKALEMAA